jgi:hypothetical protein
MDPTIFNLMNIGWLRLSLVMSNLAKLSRRVMPERHALQGHLLCYRLSAPIAASRLSTAPEKP